MFLGGVLQNEQPRIPSRSGIGEALTPALIRRRRRLLLFFRCILNGQTNDEGGAMPHAALELNCSAVFFRDDVMRD